MAPLLLACSTMGARAFFIRPLVVGSRTSMRMMATTVDGAKLDSRIHTGHANNNVPVSLSDRIGRDLHRNPNHPLGIIKDRLVIVFWRGATNLLPAMEG